MAENLTADDCTNAIYGLSKSAPISVAPKLSNAEIVGLTTNAPSLDSDRRASRDQRRRGYGKERGNGRGLGNDRGGHRRQEASRSSWSRNPVDKRKRNDQAQVIKRQKIEHEGGTASLPFTEEEIAAEERKPKRKVAVLIGYAGSGYKGMQINSAEKTIEGDLFSAFVAAGAISKANADDPKKSSLVRCARTDKGVHAAGNVISLKLIVEDPEIVAKINNALPPQIRVWGIERTNGSFSCYQTCDSRWYEYLIPTYSFIPPHPRSFLGHRLVESAEKEGVFESYQSRQADVASFWEDAMKEHVNLILDRLDPDMRNTVLEAVHKDEELKKMTYGMNSTIPEIGSVLEVNDRVTESVDAMQQKTHASQPQDDAVVSARITHERFDDMATSLETRIDSIEQPESAQEATKSVLSPVEIAIKEVKAAYIRAKKAYRISSTRRQRVQEALSEYIGTRNFHNYTVQKSFNDPSAKRVIRSFKVSNNPIVINDTEWLSLKIHGQSFMMHQIRKMVAMVALIIRCGAPLSRINESYKSDNISIPKAPGLGLLLERPVFQTYNDRVVRDYQREKIDFDKFNETIEEFKQKEIYQRIFREEENDHQFHTFFHHIDHYHTRAFLWVTSTGIPATRQVTGKEEASVEAKSYLGSDSEDEADRNDENEEG